ncbi:unnamed protein product [Acanthosepion pharaonis]|uniref:Uncharacterized protein n=1 Tax=Acanthosepion pharaonis TaxID=158019 RepID=A0A812C8T6_ACAPH|nr:unnamed protein product [Sepia pharaonis]
MSLSMYILHFLFSLSNCFSFLIRSIHLGVISLISLSPSFCLFTSFSLFLPISLKPALFLFLSSDLFFAHIPLSVSFTFSPFTFIYFFLSVSFSMFLPKSLTLPLFIFHVSTVCVSSSLSLPLNEFLSLSLFLSFYLSFLYLFLPCNHSLCYFAYFHLSVSFSYSRFSLSLYNSPLLFYLSIF